MKKIIAKSNKKENKSVLITAGPTWVAIDKVRVITNMATGETGIELAKQFEKAGFKVTLVLGSNAKAYQALKKIRIINFKYYDELKSILFKELSKENYNLVIHSAAVSDYQPRKQFQGKLRSGIKNLAIRFKPTEKIIDLITHKFNGPKYIAFKFLPSKGRNELIKQSLNLIKRNKPIKLVVANSNKNGLYKAYLVKKDRVAGPFTSKDAMAKALIKEQEKFNV